MLAFITRRALLLILVLFGVSVLLFGILMTFSPERRAAAFVTSPQQAKDIPKIIKQFGLDDPFYVQYVRWMKEVFQGNLGWSVVASRPVCGSLLDLFSRHPGDESICRTDCAFFWYLAGNPVGNPSGPVD